MSVRDYCKWLLLLSALSIVGTTIAQENTAISPLSFPKIENQDKVQLGKKLYSDVIFSKDFSLSCASCHSPSKGGADGLPRYIGINKKQGAYNTPTVYNASLNFRQFWDGRAKTLAEALDDHIKDETIFANSWDKISARLKDESNYVPYFHSVYQDQINEDNIKDALITYLNTLVTPESSFDQYLKGDQNALNADQKKGYQLFLQYGCITCHEGPNLGGNLFQKMGIYKNFFADRKKLNEADLGRFNITGKEEDKFVFKVPTLRNVALTAPYLHDGSVNTLPEVIEIMGIYEVGQPISSFDIPYLVKFLESLNGLAPKDENATAH